MKDMTVLKIVVGSSMPSPRGFRGAIGCRERTTKPNAKRAMLNTTSARTYCFQSCGPVSTRFRLAGQPHVCGHFTAFGAEVVDAERPSPKRDDLEQPARHHHVLEEVDHLVLVGKVAVECQRGHKGKQRECGGRGASLET